VPPTQALFTHFTDVSRCDELEEYQVSGVPPFAPDDAALHHVFTGGWLWALRFSNGIASAGFSITDNLAVELGLPGNPEFAWQRFLERYPSIGAHLNSAVPTRPFIYTPRLSFRTSQAAGPGWVMLPSAAGFIDPLFSTGIPLTLLGIERLGAVLEKCWGKSELNDCMLDYGELTLEELDTTAVFVGASLRSLACFPVFAAFSMFYFAAASYSEMARRLDRRRLVTRFLAADMADFRAGMHRCIEAMPIVMADPTPDKLRYFEELVEKSIDCLNVAGLAEPGKRNWYGVDLEDVVRNAHKLELTPEAVSSIIAIAPWAQTQ
jgi:FADH2 O2-dependent halogenase